MDANLITILKQEHKELGSRLVSLDDEIQRVRTELEEKVTALHEQREQIQAKVRHIQALLTLEDVSMKASPNTVNGRKLGDSGFNSQIPLADAVHKLLSDTGKEMHYRDLLEALRSNGIEVSGQDPAINLVAHIHNDPRFLRPKRGVYGLKEWYPNNLKSVGARKTNRRRKRVSTRKRTSSRR